MKQPTTRSRPDSERPSPSISRRSVLRGAAALGAASFVPRSVLGGAGVTPPSERLNIAVIGTGGRGKRLTNGFLRQADVRVVAIADPVEREDYSRFYYRGSSGRLNVKEMIEKHYGEVSGGTGGGPARCADYEDYRELLEKEKSIDAIVIATPDHVHAFASLAAIGLGKHVYCEKPLTHTVEEARRVVEAARKANVATQMGNQGNSGEGIRSTCEWIWDGAIGEVREVHAWSDAAGWPRGRTARPEDTPPVPKGMNWDLWLGPIKHRPYHPAYAPYDWRGWWAFGTGAVGDMGCHNMDPAFAALKLKYPDSIEASSTPINGETVPHASIIHFTFPARGELPPVKLTWYDGGLKPKRPEEFAPSDQFDGNGILFVGSKGKLLCDGWSRNPRLLPEARNKDYERPKKTLPRVSAHDRAWLDACKGGPAASSNFENAGPLAELVLLGNVAQRVRQKIYWDGEQLRAKNCPEAEQYIRCEYRDGWVL